MNAPQSDEELRPVIEALRRLDERFELAWNPKSIMVTKGSYDALGRHSDPTYDGRWEILMHQAPHALHDRQTVRILRVCAMAEGHAANGRKYPIMLDEGPYAPVGMWVIAYLQLYDAAQSARLKAMSEQWAEHDRLEELSHDEAAHQEALEKVYRKYGGEYWMGGAQGRAAPETAATLYADGPLRTPQRVLTSLNPE